MSSFARSMALEKNYLISFLQILGGSLFIALCAQISIPLPFSPVPITGQTFAVLLLGGVLGSKKGFLCVIAYIAEATMGLPVLAGGLIRPYALIGPTGGYLAGMAVMAYIVGWFIEQKRRFLIGKALIGCILASAIQMLMGVCWLAHFVGWDYVWVAGFYPFIPGEIAKITLASLYLSRSK
jgi:biotin transport system substrate-specific component